MQVTCEGASWRIACEPVDAVTAHGPPALWPAAPVLAGCEMRYVNDSSGAPWAPVATPPWVPHLLKVRIGL